MDYTEQSISSISFTSHSHLSSNGSISYNVSGLSGSETGSNIEIIGLTKLSCQLEQLLIETNNSDYTDADIILDDNISVGVHRCILSARSRFFKEHFKKDEGIDKNGKPNYLMKDLLPFGRIGYDAFLVALSYLYTGKLKPFPAEVLACVDQICQHDSCRPIIEVTVEVMYASFIFQIPELISVFQRRLVNFVGKAVVEDIIPILLVAVHCQSNELVSQCIQRIARSDMDRISLEKELPFEISEKIRLLRKKSSSEDEEDSLQEKRIRSIHKALDSDDVELVKLLLSESSVTLDEACALHYAASYCDPKVMSEVLSLGLADVNLRNAWGYTVLHVAARRREPSIVVSLLNKGARVSDLTFDGRSAVSICQRLTRMKDYLAKTERGKETNKDRICVDLLEREMRRNPMAGDVSPSSPIVADDLHMKLLYLENRVAFARVCFPSEAKLAMEIAHAETTSEFSGLLVSRDSSGNLKEVDLNETPSMQNKRLLSRMEALSKTVEMGRRYFPHCSQVLDKFMEDDLPDLFYLEKGTIEEQKIKRARYMELKNDVQKAFTKDKAQLQRSGLSSSSSPIRHSNVNYKSRRL
ncbi:BTB/POZ domain and ankyrin repeat-containing protein NPR1-like [Impatiens glandulifera]|uniref:BTB/POZ domain and ankyrin repeat-containing protein NPR1-like n=1 Tax=Impatiens glandulifera TaxID=253017 RepID=UPI001FB0EA6B|nr:BTB/POZ domain and ankyrin repeat-containing protein NPR1-like [Impatiens glandulifera]